MTDTHFQRLNKESSYTRTWTERQTAFDPRRRYFYYSSDLHDQREKPRWKRKMKVQYLELEAESYPFDARHLLFDERVLYTVHLYGTERRMDALPMAKTAGGTAAVGKYDMRLDRRASEKVLAPAEASLTADDIYLSPLTSKSRGSKRKLDKWTFSATTYERFEQFVRLVRKSLVVHGCMRPLHAGLPPYDPRNGLYFGLVPLYLLNRFKMLNAVVFYTLQPGLLLLMYPKERRLYGLHTYACISHDLLMCLRHDSSCPRWAMIDEIVGLHYSVTAKKPFIVILTRAGLPDILFSPVADAFPPSARVSFDAAAAVRHLKEVLERLLQLHHSGRREVGRPRPGTSDATGVVRPPVVEVRQYHSVFDYLREGGAGRPFEWRQAAATEERAVFLVSKQALADALRMRQGDATGATYGATHFNQLSTTFALVKPRRDNPAIVELAAAPSTTRSPSAGSASAPTAARADDDALFCYSSNEAVQRSVSVAVDGSHGRPGSASAPKPVFSSALQQQLVAAEAKARKPLTGVPAGCTLPPPKTTAVTSESTATGTSRKSLTFYQEPSKPASAPSVAQGAAVAAVPVPVAPGFAEFQSPHGVDEFDEEDCAGGEIDLDVGDSCSADGFLDDFDDEGFGQRGEERAHRPKVTDLLDSAMLRQEQYNRRRSTTVVLDEEEEEDSEEDWACGGDPLLIDVKDL